MVKKQTSERNTVCPRSIFTSIGGPTNRQISVVVPNPSYCTKQSPNLLPSRTQTRVAPKTLTLHRQEKGKLQTAFISYTVLTSHSLLGATPRKRSLAVGEAIFSLRMALGEHFDQLDHGEIPINCSILSIPCYPGPFQKKITPWRSE